MSKEIYVSTDIESDGPIPGPHSMLSFGSAAFTADGKMVSTFEANLELLEGAEGHPDTMAWWKTQPEAWAAHRKNLRDPRTAGIRQYSGYSGTSNQRKEKARMTTTRLIDDISQKSIEDSFRDWESSTFGFGYGSGEEHIIPALKHFLLLCNEGPHGNSYDYRKLEEALTPTVAWLFINILANHKVDMIEYGTSPRFAWLTDKGVRLKEFMRSHTEEQLVEMATDRTEDSTPCYPDACNCGPKGYVEGRKCPNPFWGKD